MKNRDDDWKLEDPLESLIVELRRDQILSYTGLSSMPIIDIERTGDKSSEHSSIVVQMSFEDGIADHHLFEEELEFLIDDRILKGFILNRDVQIREFARLMMDQYKLSAVKGTLSTFFIENEDMFDEPLEPWRKVARDIYREFRDRVGAGRDQKRQWNVSTASAVHLFDDTFRLTIVFYLDGPDYSAPAMGIEKANRCNVLFDVSWDEMRSIESSAKDRMSFYNKLNAHLFASLNQGNVFYKDNTSDYDEGEECPFASGDLVEDQNRRAPFASDLQN